MNYPKIKREIIRPHATIEYPSLLYFPIALYIKVKVFFKFFRTENIDLTLGNAVVGRYRYWIIPNIQLKKARW